MNSSNGWCELWAQMTIEHMSTVNITALENGIFFLYAGECVYVCGDLLNCEKQKVQFLTFLLSANVNRKFKQMVKSMPWTFYTFYLSI